MYKQLDLFKKSQPTDLSILEDMVSIQYYEDIASHGVSDMRMPLRKDTQPSKQIDWDIQQAHEAGDTQRVQELLTIKHDMN
jgi:hypothetical protein